MPNISLFGSVYDTNSIDNFPIDSYLLEVRDGQWEDLVYPIRNKTDEKEKDELKKLIKRVTFSGVFTKRNENGLLEHSGFIAIDLDDLEDPEVVKELLRLDKFIYAMFVSTGGKGLTILFRINPSKHRESFLGISAYLLNNYNLITDPGSIAVSKPFGVTFDPFLYVAEHNVPVFTNYIKEKKVEKLPNFAFAQDDFQKLLAEIVSRQINMCEEYDRWLKIGFSFATKFGEAGRQYYHLLSSISSKYNARRTDQQFNYCLRSQNVNVATIATFYYYCKDLGLQIFSEKTQKVRKATINSKAAGLSKKQIVDNLKKFEGIDDCEQLVSDIFEGTAQVGDGESLIEQLELFMSANYHLERNVITRFIEASGKQLEQKDLNSMFIAAKKIIDTVGYDLFERLIMSDFVSGYNPIIRFLQQFDNEFKPSEEFSCPNIDKVAASIINDAPEFTQYFFRKWIVSAIASIHGDHSPLMFVLVGERQGTGKTEFFRRLMPDPIKRYYAESKLDAGKDDEILMTQKWFIMDDEMSGKSKREEQRLKELTSTQWFSLREPYGRINVDLMRIAVLCATTNTRGILRDTQNRRILPVYVDDINKPVYNSVDKVQVFKEAYFLWRNGFNWTVLKEDIQYLKTKELDFEAVSLEKELLMLYFSPENVDTAMTASEIKVEIDELTKQKLSLDQVGKQLSKHGFERKSVKENGGSAKKWMVRKINRRQTYIPITKPSDEAPF